jgi:hypothetical protein
MCSFFMKFFSMLRYKNMAEVGCLKDGHFQNLSCEGKFVLHGTIDHEIDTGNFNIAKGNLTVSGTSTLNGISNVNRSAKTSDRYYLDEYFLQRSGVNADVGIALNRNFEILGTRSTTALCTFYRGGGITLTTAGADEDQMILAPHLDTAQTAWTGVGWGTENYTEWECSITTSAIDHQKIWAGLKLTNVQLVATDVNQAFFKFQTDPTASEAFTDYTQLHFVYSVAGTDFISQLPITVTANTNYHLKIKIDSERKASIFVNEVQYDVTTTSGTTGTAVAIGTAPTAALTAVDLIPYIGIEAGAAGAEALHVHYQCINRLLVE